MKNALLIILSIAFLTACSSINYVNIETFKPAEITFPKVINKVLIVNNAVPQPENVGYEYIIKGVAQDTARAKADSALFDACRSLGVAILETGYFYDVLLYNDPTRTDDQHIADEKLTPEKVKALCEENDVEAIISIDRMLFEMKKTITEASRIFYIGIVNVKMTGIMRAYIPERNTPLATVLLSDSIFWAEEAESLEKMQTYLPSPEDALREGGKFIGKIAAPNFVPHWDNEVRWFYTGGTTEWKQATAYANHQKWEAALPIWEAIYNSYSNETIKAKSASNIAFAYEMLGNYDKALEWAETALPIFKKKGEGKRDYQLLYHYTIALKERIRDNKKLSIQFGEA